MWEISQGTTFAHFFVTHHSGKSLKLKLKNNLEIIFFRLINEVFFT